MTNFIFRSFKIDNIGIVNIRTMLNEMNISSYIYYALDKISHHF